jgi:hypothetical protein
LKGNHQWTIAIRPAIGEKPRKITKVASLAGDGFSILVPHHKAKTGYLFKHPVNPDSGAPRFVAWDTAVAFTPRDSVKLSYHMDGFAEFSGNGPNQIGSSRDIVSEEVTGLGLFSAPLSRPIFSGPTVAITVHGIDQFELAEEHDQTLVFEPSDFYWRNCSPEDANAWMLAVYAFPRSVRTPIRVDQNRSTIAVTLEPLNGPIASVVQLAALSFSQEKFLLGLCVNRLNGRFQSISGWVLYGPGNYSQDRRGHVLMGIYPRTEIPIAGERAPQSKSSPADSIALSPREPTRRASHPPKTNKNRKRNQKRKP